MNEITYQNKVALNENPEIADINKVTDDDMNEIKSVVNGNSRTSSNNFGLGTDTWTSSYTYSIGDIVVYNDNTYKNLTGTNTTTTPDQDSTNWEVMPLIVNEYNTSTKNTYPCDYLNNHQTNAQILWTNPNPTSPILNETTITLSSSNYDTLKIFYQQSTSDSRTFSIETLKGVNGRIWATLLSNGNVMMIYRNFNRNSDISYTIGTIVGTNDANFMIPVKVIGYKL